MTAESYWSSIRIFNLTQAANADLPCVMSLVESDNRESYYDL